MKKDGLVFDARGLISNLSQSPSQRGYAPIEIARQTVFLELIGAGYEFDCVVGLELGGETLQPPRIKTERGRGHVPDQGVACKLFRAVDNGGVTNVGGVL